MHICTVYVYFIGLDFLSLNLFWCWHLETNLTHFFKSMCWSACKMINFSAKQRLQHLVPLVYADDLQTID